MDPNKLKSKSKAKAKTLPKANPYSRGHEAGSAGSPPEVDSQPGGSPDVDRHKAKSKSKAKAKAKAKTKSLPTANPYAGVRDADSGGRTTDVDPKPGGSRDVDPHKGKRHEKRYKGVWIEHYLPRGKNGVDKWSVRVRLADGKRFQVRQSTDQRLMQRFCKFLLRRRLD